MWEDFGVRETRGQVIKEEKNMVWSKSNSNVVREKLHGCWNEHCEGHCSSYTRNIY